MGKIVQLLQVYQPCVGDQGAAEAQRPEVGHSFQMLQSAVGDMREEKAQHFQVRQSPQVLQACIGDLSSSKKHCHDGPSRSLLIDFEHTSKLLDFGNGLFFRNWHGLNYRRFCLPCGRPRVCNWTGPVADLFHFKSHRVLIVYVHRSFSFRRPAARNDQQHRAQQGPQGEVIPATFGFRRGRIAHGHAFRYLVTSFPSSVLGTSSMGHR